MVVECNAKTDNALNAERKKGKNWSIHSHSSGVVREREITGKKDKQKVQSSWLVCACFPKNDGLSTPRELLPT